MFSLKTKLHNLAPHLPQGFKAENGIRSLFPKSYSGSITMLNNYVFMYSYTGSQNSSAWVGADGAGRWFFAWWNANGEWGINDRNQAGFVFRFSNDGFGHGYVDTSRPADGATSCNLGIDPWIAENWPQAFAAGVGTDVQEAEGFESLPDASNIWTDYGFAAAKFVALNGANGSCAPASAGSLFPFSNFFSGHTAPSGWVPWGYFDVAAGGGGNPFS
jgi:hypothetical protein